MSKSCLVIRHVAFEHLGSFASVLVEHGYDIEVLDAGLDDLSTRRYSDPDLLVVLGGPIRANDDESYPFLEFTLRLLERRLEERRPTLGICLGAQLIARASGASVFPSAVKEIGWSTLTLDSTGLESPLRHLEDVPVLHWHGDTLDLPDHATRLASTALCPTQAFSIGPNVLGLQFHAEVDVTEIDCWLVGHACELAATGIDVNRLRNQSRRDGPRLKLAGQAMLREWLGGLLHN